MQFASSSQEVMEPNLLRMLKSIRATIKTITTERSGLNQVSQNHHLNGTFKQLCNKSVFAEMLFPGTSAEVLDGLPKNLKEILEWEELELDLTKIAKNATDVLENIKNKGKAQGDIMDETTETVLLPQIGQEALSKGIIEAVRKLSRRVSQMSARISQAVASPTAPQAQSDQLDDEVVASLFSEQRIGVQREFLGEEWTRLIRNDIVRYLRNEKMSVLNRDGAVMVDGRGASNSVVAANLTRMCWIEPSKALAEGYAALSELITQVHALPFELNLKSKEVSQLSLLEPSKGCTMLLHYPEGSSQMSRIDSRDDGSDLDSGIRITCSYALNVEDVPEKGEDSNNNNAAASVNTVNFYQVTGGAPTFTVSDLHDTLILHKSAKVRNERAVTVTEYYVLVFFMQGQEVLK